MKKRISISLVIVLCTMSLAACGEDTAANSTSETATESTVTENSTQDSAPVSNVISDVDISDYVYYSTAGDEFVAPKENAIEGIPYELTDEEKKILIPDSDVYVITADEVKDYEYIIEGEKITYFAAASCSFTDEGKYVKDCTIFFFEDDIIAAKAYDILSASASDSVKYELDGRKVIQSRSFSGCEWIDEYVSLCIDGGFSYIVACDSGRLTGDVRARAVALFDREDTVSVADSNDKPDDQIVVADTNDNSDLSLNGTQNGNGGEETNTGGHSQTNTDSAVNALLSQAAGHYMQGDSYGLDHGGSLDLIDNGDGTFTLANIHIYYKDYVVVGQDLNAGQLGTGSWEENEWHGSSVSFGDGNGAKISRDGVVSVTLSIAGGRNTVEINSAYEAISFNTDDGRGFDFIKVN